MKKTLAISLLLLATAVMAENKIVLNVGLNPAGSFQATSLKAKGALIRDGNSFTTEKIIVSIESFKTGIELRDEHFWKHLKSSTHPKATLTNLKAQDGKATADLEVNGIKRPVNINYKVQGSEVIAEFTTKASEYGLSKAEYLGVGVSDEVKVNAVLDLK